MHVDSVQYSRAETARSRDEQLFEPLPYLQAVPSGAGAEDVDYNHLLSQESVVYAARAPKVDRYGNPERQWRPTSETRAASLDRLHAAAHSDANLARLLNDEYVKLGLSDPMQIVDALRLKPDFRLQIGTYLRGKMDSYADTGLMPDRVRNNTEKAERVDGYPMRRMRSREYATLLALSMLDGTFNQKGVSVQEQIQVNEDRVEGQHRLGALRVLDLG